MPDYKQYKVQNLMDLLGHGANLGAAGAEQQMKGQQGLQQLLQGQQQKADLDKSNAKAEFDAVQQAVQDAQKGGRKITAKMGNASYGESDPDPTKMSAAEAQKFLKTAGTAYKPINDQLDASKATLDYLNQKNASSDKLALISEARIAAGQGGSRAIKGIMDSLSGGKTAGMDFQNALNYVNNTADIPTMQDSQRDALRESVFGRIPQLGTLHNQTQAQLAQQGPLVAPHADHVGLTNSFSTPAQAKLDQLNQMGKEYQTQRAAMNSRAIGAPPAVADQSASTLDKIRNGLSSWLKPSAPAPSAAPPAPGPATPGAPVDPARTRYEELLKKSQGTPGQ